MKIIFIFQKKLISFLIIFLSAIQILYAQVTLNLKLYIEGYYTGGSNMIAVVDPVNHPNLCDSINIELHNVACPFNLNYSAKGTIDIYGNGNFTFPLNILQNKYYIVVKHRNSIETWSKDPVLFSSLIINFDFTTSTFFCPPTVTDNDGNIYNTVDIGGQCFTRENLKTSHFSDCSSISEVEDDLSWDSIFIKQTQEPDQTPLPAWCYYNNNPMYNDPYGKLYNCWAVLDPRGLCPIGWHVPSDAEWTVLTNFLGGYIVAGGAMKEAGLAHWLDGNSDATNSSGFTGLPGGYRHFQGLFTNIGYHGIYWSSSEINTSAVWGRGLYYYDGHVERMQPYKGFGYSVRCIKD